jgi:hypothetical protein
MPTVLFKDIANMGAGHKAHADKLMGGCDCSKCHGSKFKGNKVIPQRKTLCGTDGHFETYFVDAKHGFLAMKH